MRAFLSLVILSLLLTACRQVPAGGPAPGLPPVTPTTISSPTSPVATAIPPTKGAPAMATAVPLNNSYSKEVQAVLDAQKAPFTVNAEGKLVIDLGNSVFKEKIVLGKVGFIPAPDFGLDNIVYGEDEEVNQKGNHDRYILAENGWAKYIEAGTVEEPAEITQSYVDDGFAKVAAALAYTENPTMTETETKQKYEIFFFNNPSSGIGGAIEVKNGTLNFGDFDYSGVYWFLGKDDQPKFVLPIIFKNPTADNQNQLTPVFGGLDQETFRRLTQEIKINETGEPVLSAIINGKYKATPWLEVPKRASGNPSDISSLYSPRTILGLFPIVDRGVITDRFEKQDLAPLGSSEYLYTIVAIPIGLSEKIIPLTWDSIH